MENIDVILVEPLYQINLGYIARALANFGFKRLNLVNPRCKYDGKEAIKYSKHAVALLKKAGVYKSIDDATKHCDIVVGTTGIWLKSSESFFNVYALNDAKKFLRGKRIGLLIGRDDTGLTKEELRKCDLTIFVPTSKEYPVLNISHALAIILYELTKLEHSDDVKARGFYADKRSVDGIKKLFWSFIKDRSDIRDKKSVMLAFEHMLKRSGPTKKELRAISIALSKRPNR